MHQIKQLPKKNQTSNPNDMTDGFQGNGEREKGAGLRELGREREEREREPTKTGKGGKRGKVGSD